VVFTNLKDKDKVFDGGPYFFISARLYMCQWKMDFALEKESFTNVPVWIRLYSPPWDYLLRSTLKLTGNKLGRFVNTPEETLQG